MGFKCSIPLQACPFCEHTNVKVHEKRRGNYRREGDNYQVVCQKCKARGPLVKDSADDAALKWNFWITNSAIKFVGVRQ